jgi:dTDP-4-dehydrorhamnose reductase
MLKVFPPGWQVTCTHVSAAAGMIECRLEDPCSVTQAVQGDNYAWVVHCAVIRSPEACEQDPRRAVEINARAREWLARAATDIGARMAYASSPHVFAGDRPPYAEGDAPSPISVYGRSKLAGEHHALSVPGGLVVRMAALYSLNLTAPSNILAALKESLEAGRPVKAGGHYVRYYTLAEEVAAAFSFLMAAGRRGVVHVSAQRGCTQLQFLRAAAVAMGFDAGMVVEQEAGAQTAIRPRDSRLEVRLYASLGAPPFRGVRRGPQAPLSGLRTAGSPFDSFSRGRL